MLGCGGRRWIRDESLRYTDSFVLHGIQVANTTTRACHYGSFTMSGAGYVLYDRVHGIQTGARNETNVWRLSPDGGAASLHFSPGAAAAGGTLVAMSGKVI